MHLTDIGSGGWSEEKVVATEALDGLTRDGTQGVAVIVLVALQLVH
jgi:hypothetical protein